MFSITRLGILLTALSVSMATDLAHAQAWNRRISDVRIVHPPGTPPGTYRVVSTIDVGSDNGSPAALDLSMEIGFELNGIPIYAHHTDALMMPRGCQFGGSCTTNNCVGGFLEGIQLGGVCGIRGGLCACWSTIEVTTLNSILFSTDSVRVTITPSVGSMPETDLSDDAMTILVDDQQPGSSFCSNDSMLLDHATPCPCGNTGAAGYGCAHSFSPLGARLVADGSVAADDVVLGSTNLPATSFTLFMQHDAADDRVFHDGVLCAGGNLIRLRGRAAVAGDASFPNPTWDSTISLSQRGGVTPGSGVQRYYAAWFRNASTSYCPPATANVSNGWQITW